MVVVFVVVVVVAVVVVVVVVVDVVVSVMKEIFSGSLDCRNGMSVLPYRSGQA